MYSSPPKFCLCSFHTPRFYKIGNWDRIRYIDLQKYRDTWHPGIRNEDTDYRGDTGQQESKIYLILAWCVAEPHAVCVWTCKVLSMLFLVVGWPPARLPNLCTSSLHQLQNGVEIIFSTCPQGCAKYMRLKIVHIQESWVLCLFLRSRILLFTSFKFQSSYDHA